MPTHWLTRVGILAQFVSFFFISQEFLSDERLSAFRKWSKLDVDHRRLEIVSLVIVIALFFICVGALALAVPRASFFVVALIADPFRTLRLQTLPRSAWLALALALVISYASAAYADSHRADVMRTRSLPLAVVAFGRIVIRLRDRAGEAVSTSIASPVIVVGLGVIKVLEVLAKTAKLRLIVFSVGVVLFTVGATAELLATL